MPAYWMIGVPTYDGRVDMSTAQAVRGAVSASAPVRSVYSRSSLLPSAFNELICAAINDQDCEWFAMLHADIEPEQGWLTKMVEIAAECRLDVLSVVIPMRDDTGLTSTAIDRTEPGGPKQQRRLSVRETLAIAKYRPTFCAEQACDVLRIEPGTLLINTGLMLLRMPEIRQEAVSGRWRGFGLSSDLAVDDSGTVRHVIEPEDWRFSRWAAKRLFRIAATHEIRANHHGADAIRPNHVEWGMWNRDEDWFRAQSEGVSVEEAATTPSG